MAPPPIKDKKTKAGDKNLTTNTSATDTGVTKVKYSSNTSIDGIESGDKTVELLGYVESLEGPKIVGRAQKYNLLKFILNNGEGRRVQCLVWEKQIEKVKQNIQLNKILYCQGMSAKELQKDKMAYNLGNVGFELTVKSHTEIEVMGFHERPEADSLENATPISWDDLSEISEETLISISGWIKLPIKATPHKNGESSYGLGSITNKKVKMTIKVLDVKDLSPLIKKGTSVVVNGVLLWDGNIPFIKVESGTDISMGNELTMNARDLLEITAPPQKKAKIN